ncbi:MAG: hypothetical protein WBF53_09210, partial [Litorimonas sp.]
MPNPAWWITRDGDREAVALFERHYSARSLEGRTQFVGPGEHIVLRTWDCDALFVWRAFLENLGNERIECSVFRNEGPHLSSDLIRQADAIADAVWPGRRRHTFVDAARVRSTVPGWCFRRAGW